MREEPLGRFDELGLFANLHSNPDDSDEFDLTSAEEAAIDKIRKDYEEKDKQALERIYSNRSLLQHSSDPILSAGNLASNSEKKRALDVADSDEPARKVAKFTPSDRVDELATAALKNLFGFQDFRLQQARAIKSILTGDSAVVVFPTGGGKSLVYQIPALLFSDLDDLDGSRKSGDHGITLVVSPLISLMKDQCDALQHRGIMAASMDSSKTRQEYFHTCDMLQSGKLRLLYCAPERLNNEGFIAQMQTVRGGIRLLAVDEAHCISEWGHAFRPDYLKVARFAKEIRAERVVALTATATPRVGRDICKAFDIPEDRLFRTATFRPNLHLQAAAGKTKTELYPQLFDFLRKHKGSTIVYVTLQKQTEELAARLRSNKFNAQTFHAGLATEMKSKRQEEFMRSDNIIMVATIAFGMGIDKASIRNVVHFCIPSSLESYSQEIGRAGRDGKTSQCMMYLCGEDAHLREMFARGDVPAKDAVRGVLDEIFDAKVQQLRIGDTFRTNHYAQEKMYDIRQATLGNIYAQLELSHNLIRATGSVYTSYQWIPGPMSNSMRTDSSPVAEAIRKYAQSRAKWTQFNPDDAVSQAVSREEIVRKLKDWDETRVFGELKAGGVEKAYKILAPPPSSDEKLEELTTALYSLMEAREKEALQRADEVLQLATGTECFSFALARHFGDGLSSGDESCGTCTWCMTKQAVVLQLPPPVPFNHKTFKAILAKVPMREDPRLLARIAFGITSPACTALKLSKDAVFGSMDDHPFEDLLREFTKECEKSPRVAKTAAKQTSTWKGSSMAKKDSTGGPTASGTGRKTYLLKYP